MKTIEENFEQTISRLENNILYYEKKIKKNCSHMRKMRHESIARILIYISIICLLILFANTNNEISTIISPAIIVFVLCLFIETQFLGFMYSSENYYNIKEEYPEIISKNC